MFTQNILTDTHCTGKVNKNSSTPIKKISKADQILRLKEPGVSGSSVHVILANNKDTEVTSNSHSYPENHIYNPEDVINITTAAIKAVVKNKENIDQTELKKIIELWSKLHQPIITQYLANVADESAFANLRTLIESCHEITYRINFKCSLVEKYIEEILESSADVINNLQIAASWSKSIKLFSDNIGGKDNNVNLYYFSHLKRLFAISNIIRQHLMLDNILSSYKTFPPDILSGNTHITKEIFAIVEQHGTFADNYNVFRPIHSENDFNLKLIRKLISINKHDLAQQFCEEIIKSNVREEANLPYQLLVKEIVTAKAPIM